MDDLAWKAFERSGDVGTYLLYKALQQKEDD
ncbi:MAG: YqzL family protein [Clostridia bacterium]|nr:YqzL family protein [Clostridia bacterium]